MSFQTVRIGALEYLTSTLIETPHCFSTRFGGVSEGYLSSLNLGIHRGDLYENCIRNYTILGEAIGFTPYDIVGSNQIHSALVERVGKEDRGIYLDLEKPSAKRDGMVTDEIGPALTVFGADCPTILFHDPVHKAIAAAHAGWRGTVAGIAAATVRKLGEEYGTRPEDVRAAIGPCIGACCFETHADVPDAVIAGLGEDARFAIRDLGRADEGGEKYTVDLKALNELVLRRAGVTQIDVCPCCTSCESDRFWSHRVTKGHRGSQASIILLAEES